MIIYDNQKRRMMDTENGDYLLSQPADRETHAWCFNLYDQQDQPLLASIVQVNNIDEFGNSGRATLVRSTLLKTWIPTGHPESPAYFDEYHPQIPRLAAFLEGRLYAGGAKTPPPRFEFIDGRNEAAQAPPKSRVNGLHVFLGLLLTLGLHFGHVLLLSAVTQVFRGKEVWYFYFGFTQLLYMLPAIYLSRHNRGLMIGLIIGAAITFMLGLPLAALAVICGSMQGL